MIAATGHRRGTPGVLAAIMSPVTYGAFAPLVLLVTGLAEVVDTLDPASAGPQLLVLAAGGLVLLGTVVAPYRLSVRRLDRVNM